MLLLNKGFVKTLKFASPKYLGDPINILKIFNEKEVDEIIVLDINATPQRREPDYDYIGEISSECFMPFCYGGGISNIEQARKLFYLGVEKIAINTQAVENINIISDAARAFGSQSIVVSIDVKKRWTGRYEVWTHCGRINTGIEPVAHALKVAAAGAGEIFVNSMDRDGEMNGYDIELMRSISNAVSIPVIACGGAGNIQHFHDVISNAMVSAVAAGSMFVFQGKHRAVLISYLNNITSLSK